MTRRCGGGLTCTHPRQVVGKVHTLNKGERSHEEKMESDEKLRIRAWDISNFFTKVPRIPFLADVRKMIAATKNEDGKIRYF